jgi:hypothetical protein
VDLLQDNTVPNRTDKGCRSGDPHSTVSEIDYILSDTDHCWRLPTWMTVRLHPSNEEDAPPIFRESCVHNGHLSRKNKNVCQIATMTKISHQLLSVANFIASCHVKIPTNILVTIGNAIPSRSMYNDVHTSAQVINCPQWNHWIYGMNLICILIPLNNRCTSNNCQKIYQLQVKRICWKWVNKMKYSHDRSTPCLPRLGNEQLEIYVYQKLSCSCQNTDYFWYVISLLRTHS